MRFPRNRRRRDPAKLKTVGGDVDVHRFSVAGKNNEISYLVQYNDLPPEVLRDGSDKILDTCTESGVAGPSHGKQVGEPLHSTLDGSPGRAVQIEGAGFKVEYRIYLVKNRLYQLIVFGDGSKGLADRALSRF